jgi:hypothetical protein
MHALSSKRIPVPVASILLLFTVVVAFDAGGMLNGLFEWRVPAHGNMIPAFSAAWGPAVLCSIVYAYFARFGHVAVPVTRCFLALLGFILLFIVIETVSAIHRGVVPAFDLVMQILWVSFLYIALLSLTGLVGVKPLVFALPIVGAALSVSLVFAWMIAHPGDELLTHLLSGRRSSWLLAWKHVNSFSYIASICAVAALYRVLAPAGGPLRRRWLFFGLYLANIMGILTTRARGAWILLLAGSVVIAAGRLFGWRLRFAAMAGVLLAGAVAVQVVYSPLPRVNELLSLGRGGIDYQEETRREAARSRAVDADCFTSVGVRVSLLKTWWEGMTEDFNPLGVSSAGLAGYNVKRANGTIVGMHGAPFNLTLAYGVLGAGFVLFALWTFLGGSGFGGINLFGITVLAMMFFCSLMLSNVPLWFCLAGVMAGGSPCGDSGFDGAGGGKPAPDARPVLGVEELGRIARKGAAGFFFALAIASSTIFYAVFFAEHEAALDKASIIVSAAAALVCAAISGFLIGYLRWARKK